MGKVINPAFGARLKELREAAGRSREIEDALHAAERGLHRPLPRNTRAQAQRGEHLEAAQVLRGVLATAAEIREVLEGPFGLILPAAPELDSALQRLTQK